eukprot:scaffold48911_cov18-Tisochrysis_lutea.AAC.1
MLQDREVTAAWQGGLTMYPRPALKSTLLTYANKGTPPQGAPPQKWVSQLSRVFLEGPEAPKK